MSTTAITNEPNGRLFLIGGALPALLIGLALIVAGLSFIPTAQRPTSGIADMGPAFAFFFAAVLLPAGFFTVSMVVLSRLPVRPIAIVGNYGNLIFGLLWVIVAFGIGVREQQWLSGIAATIPGWLFLFTGVTGLEGWLQAGVQMPGWSWVLYVTFAILGMETVVGLISRLAA